MSLQLVVWIPTTILEQASRCAAPAATCNIYLDPVAFTLGGEGGSAVDKTMCLLLFNYVTLEPLCGSTVSVNDEAQEV
jgi:hypothetical protein